MRHGRVPGLGCGLLALMLPALSPAKVAPAEERVFGGVYSNACSKAEHNVMCLCAVVGHVVSSARFSIVFPLISKELGPGFVFAIFLHLLLDSKINGGKT